MEGEVHHTEHIVDKQDNLTEQEKRRDAAEIVAWGERVMAGEFSGHLSDYEEQTGLKHVEGSEGEYEMDDGVLLDMNDQNMDDESKERLTRWMEEKLGDSLQSAAVSEKYQFQDGTTTFSIFAKKFGTDDNPWYLSRWQNEGELPFYILWSQDMYDEQGESGYERITEETS
jgi:hypothetical protein